MIAPPIASGIRSQYETTHAQIGRVSVVIQTETYSTVCEGWNRASRRPKRAGMTTGILSRLSRMFRSPCLRFIAVEL